MEFPCAVPCSFPCVFFGCSCDLRGVLFLCLFFVGFFTWSPAITWAPVIDLHYLFLAACRSPCVTSLLLLGGISLVIAGAVEKLKTDDTHTHDGDTRGNLGTLETGGISLVIAGAVEKLKTDDTHTHDGDTQGNLGTLETDGELPPAATRQPEPEDKRSVQILAPEEETLGRLSPPSHRNRLSPPVPAMSLFSIGFTSAP
ncbi:hypothetical protein DPX16_19254 [Anabarilius grahami]|uniref:Uncharacterized protein n=1 Tax=Anabarilius grahami TaxID=495550 RepID=A0A3N0YZJ8_ANAGA|nr:hypothetical protein DPX16_19254 [Anabarilius grahami]